MLRLLHELSNKDSNNLIVNNDPTFGSLDIKKNLDQRLLILVLNDDVSITSLLSFVRLAQIPFGININVIIILIRKRIELIIQGNIFIYLNKIEPSNGPIIKAAVIIAER